MDECVIFIKNLQHIAPREFAILKILRIVNVLSYPNVPSDYRVNNFFFQRIMKLFTHFRRKHSVWMCLITGLTLLCAGLTAAEQVSANDRFEIAIKEVSAKSSGWRVNLAVSDFALSTRGATGTYEIRVPAAPWKNEKGRIYFEINMSTDELLQQGGVIEGFCIRDSEERVSHKVICYVEPQQWNSQEGVVSLTVKTKKRELTFDSEYTVIGSKVNG